MSILEFLPYIIALTIAAAIPGPGIAAAVGKALGSGLRPALYFIAGIALGDMTFLTLAILGLSSAANLFSGVFVVIKWAGASYLVWLAWRFWRAGIDPQTMAGQKGKGFLSSVIGGFSVAMSNPKLIIFYLALLPTVVDLQTVTLERYLVLATLTAIIIVGVLLPYVVLASRARVFLSNPRALKWMNRGAATAMVGAAAVIVTRA